MMQLAIVGSDKPLIWLVQPHYLIGKGRDCDIRLDDPSLLDVHLQLEVDGDRITLAEVEPEVLVNGASVQPGHALVHGDRLQLGHMQLEIVDPKKVAQSASTKVAEAKAWRLQGLSSALSNKHYDVIGTVTLGRATSCDISLGVAHLSRQHARLTPGPKGLLVEDLGSANGTYVNGERIEKAMLKTGDELKLDTLRFRVFAPGAEEDPDKTSLRPAVVTPAPKHTPAAQAPARAVPTMPRTAAVAAPVVEHEAPSETSGSGANWWLLAALVVVVLAVVSYIIL